MTDPTPTPAAPGPPSGPALQAAITGSPEHGDHHRTPGTFALVLIFLLSFAVYYFANWKALADVWHVR